MIDIGIHIRRILFIHESFEVCFRKRLRSCTLYTLMPAYASRDRKKIAEESRRFPKLIEMFVCLENCFANEVPGAFAVYAMLSATHCPAKTRELWEHGHE